MRVKPMRLTNIVNYINNKQTKGQKMEKKTEELLKQLSPEERAELLKELNAQSKQEKVDKRNAYEKLRGDFMTDVRARTKSVVYVVREFKDWLDNESSAFKEVMLDYGQLRSTEQQGFTVVEGDFKLKVSYNKVKTFDERADMAAQKLIDYLSRYIENSEKGTEDPIYQLAMSLLERNRQGQLDYKSISKLYELEDKFDSEYHEIMELFRESNVVMATAINYYFYERDAENVWHKVEPSFCRM